MLTPEQQSGLRRRLQDEAGKLASEIASLNEAIDEKADCAVTDAADAAALQERRHQASSLRAHSERALVEIDAALVRMDAGRYGISETTGEPIPYERLEVLPWARM